MWLSVCRQHCNVPSLITRRTDITYKPHWISITFRTLKLLVQNWNSQSWFWLLTISCSSRYKLWWTVENFTYLGSLQSLHGYSSWDLKCHINLAYLSQHCSPDMMTNAYLLLNKVHIYHALILLALLYAVPTSSLHVTGVNLRRRATRSVWGRYSESIGMIASPMIKIYKAPVRTLFLMMWLLAFHPTGCIRPAHMAPRCHTNASFGCLLGHSRINWSDRLWDTL